MSNATITSQQLQKTPKPIQQKTNGDGPAPTDFQVRAQIVADVAARYADAVDREARFPAEAFAAIREQKLLGLLVPTELGGESAGVGDVADVCYALGRACASTALIFAMRFIMY